MPCPQIIEKVNPSFQLLIKKFNNAPNPYLLNNWDKNLVKHKKGLTVIITDQSPYIDDAAQTIKKYADEIRIPFKIIELKMAIDAREKATSPHGTLNIVYSGKLLSYYYLLPGEIDKKIAALN